MAEGHRYGLATRMVHADAALAQASDVAPALSVATTFSQPTDGSTGSYVYSRMASPTRDRLDAVLGAMLPWPRWPATSFVAGAGALLSLLQAARPTRIVLCMSDTCSRKLIAAAVNTYRPGLCVTSGDGLTAGDLIFAPLAPPASLLTQVQAAGASLVVVVTAPFLLLDASFMVNTDLGSVRALCLLNGQALVGTVAATESCSPGVVWLRDTDGWLPVLRSWRALSGLVPGSWETWLTLRGLRTFALRGAAALATAAAVADLVSKDISSIAAAAQPQSLSDLPQVECRVANTVTLKFASIEQATHAAARLAWPTCLPCGSVASSQEQFGSKLLLSMGVESSAVVLPAVTAALLSSGSGYRKIMDRTLVSEWVRQDMQRQLLLLGAELLRNVLSCPHVALYPSGLTAVFAALRLFAPQRVILDAGYHGVHYLCDFMAAARELVEVVVLAPGDTTDLQVGDLVWLETPYNPSCVLIDIKGWVSRARLADAHVCVDATFAPPPLLDPLALGADCVC